MAVLSGYSGLLRNGYAYYRHLKTLGSPPVQVSIEPTNICNFRCAFCPQSTPEHADTPRGRMTLERCRELLGRVAEQFYPKPADRKVSFTLDGEPFINHDFPAMLQVASELGYKIKFASNGSLVTPEVIDSLLERGVRFNICVDFCADARMFESIRGPAGSHAIVLENLRHLMHRARETDAVSLDVCDITGYTTASQTESKKNLQELQRLFDGLSSERTRFSSRLFHNMTGKIDIPGQQVRRGRYRVCPYPWFNLNIAWDGSVVACCRDLCGETVLGNVFETDSLWNIWNGEPYQKLRASLANRQPGKVKTCAGCDLPWDNSRWKPRYVLQMVASRLLRLGRK